MLGCFCTSSQQPASCFKTDGRRQAAMQSSILVYRIFQPRVKFRGICWTDVVDHVVHSRPLWIVVHSRPLWIFFAHNASTPIGFQVWGSRRFWRSCHAGHDGAYAWSPRQRRHGTWLGSMLVVGCRSGRAPVQRAVLSPHTGIVRRGPTEAEWTLRAGRRRALLVLEHAGQQPPSHVTCL
jgi:hypothetical protein